MVMTREDMKDRVLVALLSCIITSSGWFLMWAKDVPTMETLVKDPPILKSIPALAEKINKFESIQDNVISIQAKVMTIQQVQNQWIYELKELQQSINLLSNTIHDIQISLARLKPVKNDASIHPPYTDMVEGNGGEDRS